MTYRCGRYKKYKEKEEFGLRKDRKTLPLRQPCRLCRNAWKVEWRRLNPERTAAQNRRNHLRNSGLSAAKYIEMLRKQEGVCAICKQPPKGRTLDIDHCHVTNTIRGLLCSKCNTAIGLLNESPTLFYSALSYLEYYLKLCKDDR